MDISRYRSDIQDRIKKIGILQTTDPQKTIEECRKLVEYGEQQRDDALIGFAHFTMGETYYLMNDIALFYLEMDRCKKPFARIREWGYTAASYNMQGIAAISRGIVPLALEQYFKAYELCEKNKYPDLKCAVRMNIAGLYLNTGYLEKALDYFKTSYKYISNHMDMDGYIERLSATLLGTGKTYLAMEDMENAWAMKNEIEQKCLPFLSEPGKLVYYCFVARLFNLSKDESGYHEFTNKVLERLSTNYAILDIFDDIYDFMRMLLETQDYDIFTEVYIKFADTVKATMVKNLEKKMLSLRLTYLKLNKMEDDYNIVSREYIELMESMETENQLTMSSIITLRDDLEETKRSLKEEKEKSARLNRRAMTDPLTAMANRLQLNDYAETAFNRAITNQVGFATEFLDVDYFKEYNDNYGHEAGDRCLLFISNAITKLSKNHSGVHCYRYGGDEFVIIYQSFSEAEVFEMAKELKNSIVEEAKEHEFSKDDEKIVTISQGLFWGVPEAGDSVWRYLREADKVLYKVKRKSRNSIMLGKDKHNENVEETDSLKPIITELKDEEYLPAED